MSDEPYLGDLGPAGENNGQAEVLAALSVLSTELGENRAHVAELRAHLDDVLKTLTDLQGKAAGAESLSTEVTALADTVAQLVELGVAPRPPKPVDLAHIAAEDRDTTLGELVEWVREVLFTGWPWTASRLRSCWLLHPDLVNAMLWLQTAYLTAYKHVDRRAHNAADFHHWLEEAMQWADERTAKCPRSAAEGHHPVPLPPRDDLAVLAEVARRDTLAEIHRQMQIVNAPEAPEDARVAARAVVSELTQVVSEEDYRRYVIAVELSKAEQVAAEEPPKPRGQRRR